MITYEFKSKTGKGESIPVVWMHFSHSEHEFATVYIATNSNITVSELEIHNLFKGVFFEFFYHNNLKILVFISQPSSNINLNSEDNHILYCDPYSQKVYIQSHNGKSVFEIKNILSMKEKISPIPYQVFAKNIVPIHKIQEEKMEIKRSLTILHPNVTIEQSQKIEKIKNKVKRQPINIIQWKQSQDSTEIIYKMQISMIIELRYHEKFINTKLNSIGYLETNTLNSLIVREKILRFHNNHNIKLKINLNFQYKLGNIISFSLFDNNHQGLLIKIEHFVHCNEYYSILEVIYNPKNEKTIINSNKSKNSVVQNVKLIDIFQKKKSKDRNPDLDPDQEQDQNFNYSFNDSLNDSMLNEENIEDGINFNNSENSINSENVNNLESLFDAYKVMHIDELSEKVRQPSCSILRNITQSYLIK